MSEPAVESYVYELRENGSLVATGRFTLDQQLQPGDSLRLGQLRVRVRERVDTARERRLILERS